jgi:FixJ family two-component response regulator
MDWNCKVVSPTGRIDMPIIFITSYGDVLMTVRVMNGRGAATLLN